jgi:hypothetical protein
MMNFRYQSLAKPWQTQSRFMRTRLQRWLLGGILFTVVVTLYGFSSHGRRHINTITEKFAPHFVEAPPLDLDQPPTYEHLKKWEMDLPQHNLDLPFPEGRTGRYVLFHNQIQMLGWNNQLNEV